jgi:hypothetical protein
MPDRYWVGSGTWNSTSTANWSATSTTGATGASVPTVADDVIFDANSGNCTLSTTGTRTCRSLTMTGYTNTMTLAVGTGAWTVGDASGGAFTLASGMTLTNSGSWTITFAATSTNGGAGWPITTAGKTLPSINLNGVGGRWQLQDALTCPIVLHGNGHFDTNSQTIVTTNGGYSQLPGTSGLTLGSTQWTCGAPGNALVLNNVNTVTFTANTAVFTVTSGVGIVTVGKDLNGASLVITTPSNVSLDAGTWRNVTKASSSTTLSLSGTLIVTNTLTLSGVSATNRALFQSSAVGTTRVIEAQSTSFENVDFMDIMFLGPVGNTVLVSDSFNRSSGALGSTDSASGGTSKSWSTVIGTPAVTTSNTAGSSSSSGDTAAVVDVGASDYYVEVTLGAMASARRVGVRARAVDASSYIWADGGNNSGLVNNGSIGYVVNGALVQVASGNQIGGSPGWATGDRIGIQVYRNVFAVYRNGTRVTGFFQLPPQLHTSPNAGIVVTGGTNVTVDNFAAYTQPDLSITGTMLGDCLGNSGIVFTTQSGTARDGGGAGVKRFAVAAGNWSSSSTWSETDGGAAGASPPLPQDDVYLTASSGAGTYTQNLVRACRNLDCTGFTRTLAFQDYTIYGSFVLSTGMTLNAVAIHTLRGRGTHTIDTAGKTINVLSNSRSFNIIAPGGSYTLASEFVMTGGSQSNSFHVQAGTFNTADYPMTIRNFEATVNHGVPRIVNLGNSTITIQAAVNHGWIVTVLNLTVNATSSTIVMAPDSPSTNLRPFSGGDFAYGTLTYTSANGSGPLSISGNNSFTTLNVGAGKSVTLAANSLNTVGTLNASGVRAAGVRLRGSALSTPDYPALYSNELDIRLRLAANAWNQQNAIYLQQWGLAGNRSWQMSVNATGREFGLNTSADGGSSLYRFAAVPFSDGTPGWLRATYRNSDGRVQLFIANDSASMPSSWTLQSTQTANHGGLLFNSTAPLEIGTSMVGLYYYVQIRNNVLDDGTGIVFDLDLTQPRFDPYFVDTAVGAIVTPSNTLANIGDGRVVFESATAGTSAALNVSNPVELAGVDLRDVTINGDVTLGSQSVVRTNVRGVRRSPRTQGLLT